MVDNGPSYAEMGVTKVEAFQADRRMVNPAVEMKISQALQSQRPDIQKALATDPFSEETQKMTHLEQGSNFRVALRAAIMAEPAGAYEKQFAALDHDSRREKLFEQADVSAEMTVRTVRYAREHLEKLKNMPDGEVYSTLCHMAFGTDDPVEIGKQYARSQRAGFRLGIANFLETREMMRKYQAEAAANPQGLTEQLFGQKLQGKAEIESLPIGMVIYLDEKDYLAITDPQNGPQSVPTNGATITTRETFPKELRGRVIVINRGGEKSSVRTKKQLSDTKDHEIKHVLFSEFHARQGELRLVDVPAQIAACKTPDDFRAFSDTLYQDFSERAKDEIAAYFSTGRIDTNYDRVRYTQYHDYLITVAKELLARKDLPDEDRKAIYRGFAKHREMCFDTVRSMRLVAENMHRRSEVGLIDRDKAVALLMNTPATKIYRLAKYTDWKGNEEDIRSGRVINERDKDAGDNLQKLLTVPDHRDKHWEADAKRVCGYLKTELPPQSLPGLLKSISAWSEKEWTAPIVRDALGVLEEFLLAHGMPDGMTQSVKMTLNEVLGSGMISGEYANMQLAVARMQKEYCL